MTKQHPPGATLHLGGDAWAHPGIETTGADLHPAADLTPYPSNPRRGDQGAITASPRDLGLYRPLIAQRTTSHVLAGNHTLRGLLDLGATKVPVTWLDVDDVRAAAIVARDNRTSELGTNDDAELLQLLAGLEASDNLALAGYADDDTAALRRVLEADAPKLSKPNAVPPVPAEPRTRKGDVWQLGRHRVTKEA